jgi:hypothetical protein
MGTVLKGSLTAGICDCPKLTNEGFLTLSQYFEQYIIQSMNATILTIK